MSCLIGEPLALDATKKNLGALRIFYPERLAIAVPEVEFCNIAVQMVGRAVLINAFHPALEDRKETLDSIGMDGAIFPSNVFLVKMPSEPVIREVWPHLFVVGGIIGHDAGFAIDVRLQQRHDGFHLDIVDYHATRPSGIAVDERKNLVHARIAALGLLPALIPTDKGFVNFYDSAIPAERFDATIFHRFPDAVRHEPRGFQSDPQGAMQLVRANSFLARRNEEDSLQPKMQRDMARFEDGADLDGKRLAAVVALIGAYAGAFATHLGIALYAAAMRAYRAARPYTGLDKGVSFFFVVKVRGVEDGISHDLLLCMAPLSA